VQENHDTFDSVYCLSEEPIGTGAFAEVWLGTHKRTGDIRAIKIFKKSEIPEEEIESRSVLAEVEILKTLDHPNILKVYEYFEDDEHYYIVMEYCEGGDIFDKIERSGRITEKYAAKVMIYLLKGVNYLHSRQVVHRDIKPENILITNKSKFVDMNIKIIDFNVATKKSEKVLRGITGTTDYMAPEVFTGVYDEKCDLWSCGVVLYLMICGQLPFPSPDDEAAERAIRTQKLEFPADLFEGVSRECKDLISKLMTKNPKSRLNAIQALSHPWLSISDESIDRRVISTTLRKMQSHSPSSKLKEVFTTFMISQMSKSSSFKKLEQVFYAIDSDKNGVITKDELVKQLSLEMRKDLAEEKASKMLDQIDNDGSGEIDFTEFLKATVDEKTLLTKENLRKTFMYFDKDSSNAIEKEELIDWLGAEGIIPEEIINDLMEEADINGDGTIDIDEFEALLFDKLEIPQTPKLK
jgi:calcium-dependent protein kinase